MGCPRVDMGYALVRARMTLTIPIPLIGLAALIVACVSLCLAASHLVSLEFPGKWKGALLWSIAAAVSGWVFWQIAV